MASKKYKFMLAAAAVIVFQTISYAQTTTDWGWNWKDSSVVPVKKMPQYNEFLSNSFPYPPKPRNQWELGLSVGNAFIIGDRPILTGGYNGGLVGGISLRKAIGHVVSLRAAYWGSFTSVPHYSKTGEPAAKNMTHMGSIDAIFSLNTLSYYRGNPKWDIYVLGGYSLIATQVTTYRSDGAYHILYYPQNNLVTTVGGNTVSNRKGWGVLHGANVGGGLSYKLSNKINLGAEQRFTIPVFGLDYLDGFAAGVGKDIYSYSTLRLNINL